MRDNYSLRSMSEAGIPPAAVSALRMAGAPAAGPPEWPAPTDHLLQHTLRVFGGHTSDDRQFLRRVRFAAVTLDHRANGPEDDKIVSLGEERGYAEAVAESEASPISAHASSCSGMPPLTAIAPTTASPRRISREPAPAMMGTPAT
ncbi:hypothetical protein ABGB18_30630 [Nonomuraea sp. B12E4]|uniref:hypothetical protein n=1 Tax=Nonomuraea sp. B12E4 TaxID=3153564 RepID=UPI00325C95DE